MNRFAVVDTNVWISGIFWGGTPFKILKLFYDDLLTPYFSLETFSELEEKLSEAATSLRAMDRYVVYRNDVKRRAIFVQPIERVSVCRDPKDNQFLDVAVASAAPYLITGDKDLLSLKKFRTTTILSPRRFLATKT
ncbi:putative toxin-antitoxin system toxin component, PIN family [Candidatus Gottesmanbacteria bacterium]|nr:putative toxin-antitoxin system toxin component, PIN family [Candidatus Gottesmanbacteria bacterium]